MFPSFIGILDIQSWWEVPSIAYFCSLFRTAFNLLDFDIEELEEALLTDGAEDSSSSLLTELIVNLLNGCLGNNDISAFNYQMYLRRLFRRKCQETGRHNPFDNDIDFQFLPLRTKVEILYALCDFRLDAEDVFDLFKNLEAESLRVEPLGWDDNDSAYWYFYGTRLYREDHIKKPKGKGKKKKVKEGRRRGRFYSVDWLDDDDTERVWQVVCFTEEDWTHLTDKFRKASSKVEKELYRSLSQNFLPEIPRLFQEKEKLQRKRLLGLAPRRTSSRVLQKIKQKEEENKPSSHEISEERKVSPDLAREDRAKRRNLLRSTRSKSSSTDQGSGEDASSDNDKRAMPPKVSKRSKSRDKRSKNSSATQKGEPPPPQLPPPPPVKSGRKTNNSLACATGQIVIPDHDEPVSSTRKKLKTSQIFSQTEEDIQTDMYKVLEQLTGHEDAWPFMDPVEEEYAPNYYAVIRRPMDLHKMEERLDSGYYTDFSMFKADFKLIVNNCRLYNGQDNEYTTMVDNLQAAFERLTEKYIHRLSSSDEEIAVEYQLPTPSRKHKIKPSESPNRHKRSKRKSHSETGESSQAKDGQDNPEDTGEPKAKKMKLSHHHKHKDGKGKKTKRRKGHHRHGKHSKNRHRKDSNKTEYTANSKKHGRKQKHSKNKDKDGKKSKQKRKKSKHQEVEPEIEIKRAESASRVSEESSSRSRSASPLPSIHTPSPSPEPTPAPDPVPSSFVTDPKDPDFYKDKYDKIKERRRHAAKDAWESLFDYKQKSIQKQSLHLPEKDKNPKLRATIEKLRAKNKKYKEKALFNSLFATGQNSTDTNSDSNNAKESSNNEDDDNDEDDPDFSDEDDKEKHKVKLGKRGQKKATAKNESASEALEQAVKDISKWLDDAPKASTTSSPCDSPAQTISTEEQDSRLDDDISQGEKPLHVKKELLRKRNSSKETKVLKRREIQRTIDRLQPGKSKGNLLTNKNTEKVDESVPIGPLNKVRDANKAEESSPKLSLGSVLPTVEFTLGSDLHFANKEDNPEGNKEETSPKTNPAKDKTVHDKTFDKKMVVDTSTQCTKKDAEVETEPQSPVKLSQEKATPNLSAWFKAFGAPKSVAPTPLTKKKSEETDVEDKPHDSVTTDSKTSPKNTKYDSPDTPNPDGGDSPSLPSVSATPRQRRTSTGSSVSERSSFSQDLDSPRHQMSHTSPLLRSPASPRDDFQKISYPIINGTVRAGFYQDTTSIKSSPEKSCSPREAPQSPYSPYSQHVYATNNVMGPSTPNYFVDPNKSPLPSYHPPTYYDARKSPAPNKSVPASEIFPTLVPAPYSPNPIPLAHASYSHSQPPSYSHAQQSPLSTSTDTSQLHNPIQSANDSKTSLFPVKKRAYNEPESQVSQKVAETKEVTGGKQNKTDYQKLSHTLHSMSSLTTPSVDDIALALSEKSELAKSREKGNVYTDRTVEKRDVLFDHNATKKDISGELNEPVGMLMKSDNVDMVNMGYMNPDDRKPHQHHHHASIAHEVDYSMARDMQKSNMHSQQKGYEVEAINLGTGSQNMQKAAMQLNMNPNNAPPAHVHDRPHTDVNQSIAHAHHNQYEMMHSGQTISNFSLNDIEVANKKLFACNSTPSSSSLEYSNWKMPGQMRKQDILPSDYSSYATSGEKQRSDINSSNSTMNYNKALQQQQYSNYNVPRSTSHQRTPELRPPHTSELRIPNPRGHLSLSSVVNESDLMSSKNADAHAKAQKSDKHVQNLPMTSSIAYKTPYSTHSSIPLDNIRNLSNIPQMLERYNNDERYLSSFAGGASSLYHDKTFQMAQMFSKSLTSEAHPVSSAASIYSQTSMTISNKDSGNYKTSTSISTSQVDSKPKRRKRTSTTDTKSMPMAASQSYHTPCTTDVLSSVKSSMMPGSAFNFGATANMPLGGGLYGESSGFSIEDFRNSTANQLMAANYMAAAVAHQQRNNAEASAEKVAKPAHQSSTHTSGSFPFLGHSQVRAGYPFVSADQSSPLYQQYLQRHQEELLRQTGAQIMGLYPPPYPAAAAAAAALGVRQPYDTINRPSWI